jgi:hypothetical protein
VTVVSTPNTEWFPPPAFVLWVDIFRVTGGFSPPSPPLVPIIKLTGSNKGRGWRGNGVGEKGEEVYVFMFSDTVYCQPGEVLFFKHIFVFLNPIFI